MTKPVALRFIAPGVAAAWVTVVACGCATTEGRTEAAPVPSTGQVYRLETVSIRSPGGPDWVEFREYSGDLTHQIFLRKGPTPSNNYMTDVAEVAVSPDVDTLDEIREKVVQRLFGHFGGDRRYEVTSEKYTPSTRYGVPGYDYRGELKDFEAPNMGHAEYLAEIMFGHVFAHPDVPGRFIVIGYQERGHPAELDADAEAKAEAFFTGLDLRRK